MPKDKTILETIKDSPYKDYTFDYLTTTNLSGLVPVCKLMDMYYNIPEMKDGEMNPDSWVSKNFILGEELMSKKRHADPDAKTKYVPDNSGAPMDRIIDEDISDLDKKISKFYNDVTSEYRKFCKEREKDPDFKAFRNMFDTIMMPADYQSGDYFSAMADSPYLMPLINQTGGMPNFQTVPLADLKKGLEGFPSKDGKPKEPLGMMEEYFRCANELLKREYEKQKLLKDGYTPEQEKKYLDDLKRDMTATVTNFDKLTDFCKEHPDEYKEGKILNNDLDHTTGVDNKHNRDAGHVVGHIRGQLSAIENGWGMEELTPLGALGELKQRLETDVRKGDYRIYLEETHVNSSLKKIEKAKEQGKKDREKTAREDLEKYKVQKQQEVDKKEQSESLLDDMKELDKTVTGRKVKNAADKMEVINAISDFAEKKGKEYPNTVINQVFGTELKTLINETREKVFGDLQLDKGIKALEDGQKGTWFGKNDYDKVLKDMKALNEMYKANKEAFLRNDKTAVTPEMKAKEQEVLEGMKAYKLRKEEEFEKNRASGKEDNANSRRRYNAMDKAMNDLLVRMDYNNRLENGFAPEIKPILGEELPQKAPAAQAPDVAQGNRPAINEETLNYLRALKTSASNARGILHDSDQYLAFCAAIDNITDVTESILDARKKGRIVDDDAEYEKYKKAVQTLKISAKDYEDYKLSDHTEDPQAEPKMKKLNSDDREKLDIVRAVLHNNRHFNTGEPVPDIVERRLAEAQEKIRSEKNGLAEDQYPDRDELKNSYADVAAANHIRTRRRHGELIHITEDQFEKAAESFIKMPAFRKAIDEGTDKDLYEHAVSRKGQSLYEDIGKAQKALNAQDDLQKNNQPARSNNKTLERNDRTLGS